MSGEDKKPHVEFAMSANPLAEALSQLGVASPTRPSGVPAWPGKEDWEPYIAARSAWHAGLLTDEERKAIESGLEGVENGYAAWLQAETLNPTTLRKLSKELDAIESLLRGAHAPHATFPYFARFFLLESLLFSKLMELGDATGADQIAKVRLWWRSRDYLQSVFQSAYAERVGQIVLRPTGALKDRLFVEDLRTREALTLDTAAGGQDELELRRVRQYLASEAAWRYIRDLGIEEGALVLTQAHATITVTANSRIQQDQLVDPTKFWQEQQASIEAEIENHRAACGEALDRLLVPVLAVSALERPTPIDERAAPEYWGYLETIIPGVIGMVPVVGPAVSIVWSVYLKLIGGLLYPDAPDPLIEFEKKMEALIFDKIAEADAKWINNMLKGIEDELKSLLNDYKNAAKPIPANSPIRTRAIALFQLVLANKHHLLDPSSGSFYKVAPYYWRYFICYQVAAEMAQNLGDSRDFLGLRKVLYQDTQRQVKNAIYGMCGERISRIRIMNTSNGCSSDIKEVNDYRVDKKFSSDLRSRTSDDQHHATVACQWAAGMATAIQHMREMTYALNEMIVRDTAIVNTSPSGLRSDLLTETYYQAIWYLQGQCWSGYEMLRRANIAHLVHADVGKMNGATEAQRRLTETQFPGTTIFQL